MMQWLILREALEKQKHATGYNKKSAEDQNHCSLLTVI